MKYLEGLDSAGYSSSYDESMLIKHLDVLTAIVSAYCLEFYITKEI